MTRGRPWAAEAGAIFPGGGLPIKLPPRRDPAVMKIVAAWRALTGQHGRGSPAQARPTPLTVVACSGGADSTALLLALRTATDRLIVAHILHDQRPPDEATVDRDATASLAAALDLPCVYGEARSRACQGGQGGQGGRAGIPPASSNIEGALRRERYRELARLASIAGAPWVATAHHAGDQVESVLMGLLRGAGSAGLAGIAPRRTLGGLPGREPVYLIRPMLTIDPAESRRLCRAAGVAWREDPTNLDTTRLRARLRATILPELLAARPAALRKIGEAAALQRRIESRLRRDTASVFALGEPRRDARGELVALAWQDRDLRAAGSIVAGRVLREAAIRLRRGRPGSGADRIASAHVQAALRMLRVFGRSRERDGGAKAARWSGAEVSRLGHTIEVRRARGGE